jgi:hypothetical protein
MDKAKLHIAARAHKNNEDIMFKPKAGWVIGYGLRQAMLCAPIENSVSCPRITLAFSGTLFVFQILTYGVLSH